MKLRPIPKDFSPYTSAAGWLAAEVAFQVAQKNCLSYPTQVTIEAGINAGFWPLTDTETATKLAAMLDNIFSDLPLAD